MKELIQRLFTSKLARNSIWLLFLQGFNTIVPMLTIPYITRILSKSCYGEFSLALNWIGYFQVIVEYGFGLTGARKVAMLENKNDIKKIRSNIIFARMLLIVVSYSILGVIFLLAPVGRTQLMCTIIMSMMIIAIAFQQNWFFQGIQEMQNILIINVISRIISVALIFICVKEQSDLYLYCFLYVSNYLIASIAGCIIVNYKYKIGFCFTSVKSVLEELKDGWYLFISSTISKIFGSVGITVLGFIGSKEAVGSYSAINKIPYVMILTFSALSQAIYPPICQAFAGSYYVGISRVKKLARPIISAFTIIGIVLMIGNRFIVKIIFGQEYVEDSLLLIPFTIWVLLSIINNFLGVQILVASGHQKEYSRAFQFCILIMLLLMFIFGYLGGAYGIAIAQVILEILLSVILLTYIRKRRWHECLLGQEEIK